MLSGEIYADRRSQRHVHPLDSRRRKSDRCSSVIGVQSIKSGRQRLAPSIIRGLPHPLFKTIR